MTPSILQAVEVLRTRPAALAVSPSASLNRPAWWNANAWLKSAAASADEAGGCCFAMCEIEAVETPIQIALCSSSSIQIHAIEHGETLRRSPR